MATKKNPKSFVRKIGKIGTDKNHSYYVTIPISFIRGLKWREGQKVVVKRVGKKIHIIDWQV